MSASVRNAKAANSFANVVIVVSGSLRESNVIAQACVFPHRLQWALLGRYLRVVSSFTSVKVVDRGIATLRILSIRLIRTDQDPTGSDCSPTKPTTGPQRY